MDANKNSLLVGHVPVRCKSCNITTCPREFHELVRLTQSGLTIYAHEGTDSEVRNSLAQRQNSPVKNEGTSNVHSETKTEVERKVNVGELNKYNTNCMTCISVIKHVRNLLDEIRAIRAHRPSAFCDHCRRCPGSKCKRCQYILERIQPKQKQILEEQQKLFAMWLMKVKDLMENISRGGNICTHRLYKDTADAAELENLLKELDSPVTVHRQLDIGAFPSLESDSEEMLAESRDMLQELIKRLRMEGMPKRHSPGDISYIASSKGGTSCVCKSFADKLGSRESLDNSENLSQKLHNTPQSVSLQTSADQSGKERTSEKPPRKEPLGKEKPRKDKPIKEKQEKGKPEKDKPDKEKLGIEKSGKQKPEKEKTRKVKPEKEKPEKEKPGTEPKAKERPRKDSELSKISKSVEAKKENISPKSTKDSAGALFLQLLAKKEPKPEKEKPVAKEKIVRKSIPSFILPELKPRLVKEVIQEVVSESVLECNEEILDRPTDMIRGTEIIPYHDQQVWDSGSRQPLWFKVKENCPEIVQDEGQSFSTTQKNKVTPKRGVNTSGVIQYRLSDRQFIDKGWTQLPSTKIERRMNIYKMIPTCPQDWFDVHKNLKYKTYDSGEKLVELDENGDGRWFYRNGQVALHYYKPEESLARKRYVVYSSEALKNKKFQTVLACFDYLGNGVVYDTKGRERLKYNQTEGQLIDPKLGPPSRWKWHTLNDPPILQLAFKDTHPKNRSPALDEIILKTKEAVTKSADQEAANEAMLAIELENFVREKAHKLTENFKPFQIRAKVVKINEHFSLRVLDQSNIYLLFRDGALTFKLNLGMILQSTEIINTEVTDMAHVATPYDHRPPKTNSIMRLQESLQASRTEHGIDGGSLVDSNKQSI